MANPEVIADLVKRFKEYRLAYGPTRQEAAEKAGVSLITLRLFENGKVYNGNFLFLLRVVNCLEQMDGLLPVPVSAYTME